MKARYKWGLGALVVLECVVLTVFAAPVGIILPFNRTNQSNEEFGKSNLSDRV